MKIIIIILFVVLLINFVSAKNIKLVTYKFNSKDTEFDDGTHELILGGEKYANSQGLKLKDVPSLTNCEYCHKVKYISEDSLFPVTIHNINWTHINFTVHVSDYYKNQKIPITIYDRLNESNIIFSDEIKLKNQYDGKTFLLPFGLQYIIKWGLASTLLNLTIDHYGVGEAEESDSNWNTAHDAAGDNKDSNFAFGVGSIDFFSYTIQRGFFPANKSALPENYNITSASLNTYIQSTSNDDDDGDDFLAVVGNITMVDYENIANGDYNSCGAITNPKEYSNRIDLTDISGSTWIAFTINKDGLGAMNGNDDFVRFGLREGHDIIRSATGSGHFNQVLITGSDNTDFEPYYNITYDVVAPPADSCTYSSGDWEVDCADNCIITDTVDIGGNDLILSGSGSFTVQAEITGVGDVDANCDVDCDGGCFV